MKIKKLEPDYRFDGKLRQGAMRLAARKLREFCADNFEDIDPEDLKRCILEVSDFLDESSRTYPTTA